MLHMMHALRFCKVEGLLCVSEIKKVYIFVSRFLTDVDFQIENLRDLGFENLLMKQTLSTLGRFYC